MKNGERIANFALAGLDLFIYLFLWDFYSVTSFFSDNFFSSLLASVCVCVSTLLALPLMM